MSYLIYVAYFGEVVVIFLWLRDARIFFRPVSPVTGKRHIMASFMGRSARSVFSVP